MKVTSLKIWLTVIALLLAPLSLRAQSLPTVTSGTLNLHLDAGVGVSTAGTAVTQWDDQSGNNNHFGQATPADRPQLIGSALNGLPAVRFSNSDLNVIGTGLNSNPAQPFSFFAVTAGGTNPRGLFDSAPGQANVFRHYADNNVELWNGAPNLGFSLDAAGSVVSTSAYLNNSKRNLSNREFFGPNGLDAKGAFSTNTTGINFTNPNIGSINNSFGVGAYGGDVSELLVYQGQLSVPDRFAVEQYLRNKYGINPAEPATLQQLPNPVISNSSTPFNGDFQTELVQDGNFFTDYASQGQGTDTFIDFDFGDQTLITQVDYYDRASSGVANGSGGGGGADNVTMFDLIFSDDAIFGNGDDTVVSVNSPGFADLDTVILNGGDGILAQHVRFDVTAAAGANPGAAEFVFFTTTAVVPEPTSIALWTLLGMIALGSYIPFRRKKTLPLGTQTPWLFPSGKR